MVEYKPELSSENKKIAEKFGLTEWFPGIDELEFADDSMKDTIKDLRDEGLKIRSIYNGYGVTITLAEGTEDEKDFDGFGESIEEAIANATPIRDTEAEEFFNKEMEEEE